MSQQLINRNPQLKRLRDEGFNIRTQQGFLVVDDIWYVAADRSIRRGRLVTDLPLSGDVINGMGTHVMHFAGEYPCDANGSRLEKLSHGGGTHHLPDLVTDHSFSSKPTGPDGLRDYMDYHEKVFTYALMISSPAMSLDSTKDPRTFPPYETTDDESVFRYFDTASSRAGIAAITAKLELSKVAIVGLGGTGSYILDLVAKTPVKEIHLFDHDDFQNHNAFRAPGATSFEQVTANRKKVEHFADTYSAFRRGIHAHVSKIDDSNVDVLGSMAFVFLAIDSGPAKRLIVAKLEEFGVPFIDVGMGLNISPEQQVYGSLRVATSTTEKREHIKARNRIPYGEGDPNNLYATNIQVADLNCFNACLAVIKWKKLLGFYTDIDQEHFSVYDVDGNHLKNEDAKWPDSDN